MSHKMVVCATMGKSIVVVTHPCLTQRAASCRLEKTIQLSSDLRNLRRIWCCARPFPPGWKPGSTAGPEARRYGIVENVAHRLDRIDGLCQRCRMKTLLLLLGALVAGSVASPAKEYRLHTFKKT